MQPLAPFALILLLAFLAEGLTEYFARPILAAIGLNGRSPLWLRYVAMLVGVGLAFGYGADLILLLGFPGIHPLIGIILTGIIIGRGSNYANDLLKRFTTPRPT